MSFDTCQLELTQIVRDTGDVSGYLGGFEIIVLKENEFPYPIVFDYLSSISHDIWVVKREERIVIKTKPASF